MPRYLSIRHSAFSIAVVLLSAGCRIVPGRDVRYEPTPAAVVRQMLTLARVGPGDVVFDLGSGDGRIPITAARDFGARGVGIEIDPVLVERANANARAAGVADRVEFKQGDMYTAALTGATVVTLFLHPGPNLKLRPRLKRELPGGARVVSYMWNMGDWPADTSVKVNRHRIFLWTIPAIGATEALFGRPAVGSKVTSFIVVRGSVTDLEQRPPLAAGVGRDRDRNGRRAVSSGAVHEPS